MAKPKPNSHHLGPRENGESGSIMAIAILFLTLAALIVATALDTTSSEFKTAHATKERSTEYYASEKALNEGVNWLRANSTGIALLFSRSNFYNNFDRSAPTIGSNDTAMLAPTKIKIRNSSNTVLLSSAAALGTSAFPPSLDTQTGAVFAASSAFASTSFSNQQVRITLVDAIANDPSKDYGDPDGGAAAPETDFYPVYRVDAMNTQSDGSHLSGYLKGHLTLDYGIGFYGRDTLELRQECDSYLSNSGPYSAASRRPNCSVGSDGALKIHQNEAVYGKARSDGYIDANSPFGGKVCADFLNNCPNAGETCQGASCKVPNLPTYSTWATYCPTNQGDMPHNTQTLSVAGNAPNQKCWANVEVLNKKVVTLDTTTYSYFINLLKIDPNGRINFAPDPNTGTINLYVREFDGDKFNGNQVMNINNKPYQLRIHYLGTNTLVLNGNAAMNAFIIAPYATVEVQGNFTFSGGIKAKSLIATGSGDLHYDESGDITTISDTTYTFEAATEHYRK